jgi:hypothetical protein
MMIRRQRDHDQYGDERDDNVVGSQAEKRRTLAHDLSSLISAAIVAIEHVKTEQDRRRDQPVFQNQIIQPVPLER